MLEIVGNCEKEIHYILECAIKKAYDYEKEEIETMHNELLTEYFAEKGKAHVFNNQGNDYVCDQTCVPMQYNDQGLAEHLKKILLVQIALQKLVNEDVIMPLFNDQPIDNEIQVHFKLNGYQVCPKIKIDVLPYSKFVAVVGRI